MVHCTAFFCDRAASDAGGRLEISGLNNELYAPGFPARQDHLMLVVLLEWPRTTAGRVPLRIDINDPDGKSIFSIEAHTDVDPREAGRAPAKTHLLLPLNNLMFPCAGSYSCELALPDATVAVANLHLVESTS